MTSKPSPEKCPKCDETPGRHYCADCGRPHGEHGYANGACPIVKLHFFQEPSPAPQGTPGPREGSFSELYKEHAEFLARTPYKVRQATNEELKANLGGWVMTSPTINGFYNSRSEADADVIKAGYAYEAGAKAERAALEDRLRYVIGHLNANPGLQDTHELFKMIESALGKE